jgi:hypothetical protein
MAKDCRSCKYRLQAIFKKPTEEEIRQYAKEIGFITLDVSYFFWKNESVGWVDNKGRPYKNWKGVVQTWKKAAVKRGEIKEQTKSFKEKYEENI